MERRLSIRPEAFLSYASPPLAVFPYSLKRGGVGKIWLVVLYVVGGGAKTRSAFVIVVLVDILSCSDV